MLSCTQPNPINVHPDVSPTVMTKPYSWIKMNRISAREQTPQLRASQLDLPGNLHIWSLVTGIPLLPLQELKKQTKIGVETLPQMISLINWKCFYDVPVLYYDLQHNLQKIWQPRVHFTMDISSCSPFIRQTVYTPPRKLNDCRGKTINLLAQWWEFMFLLETCS